MVHHDPQKSAMKKGLASSESFGVRGTPGLGSSLRDDAATRILFPVSSRRDPQGARRRTNEERHTWAGLWVVFSF